MLGISTSIQTNLRKQNDWKFNDRRTIGSNKRGLTEKHAPRQPTTLGDTRRVMEVQRTPRRCKSSEKAKNQLHQNGLERTTVFIDTILPKAEHQTSKARTEQYSLQCCVRRCKNGKNLSESETNPCFQVSDLYNFLPLAKARGGNLPQKW